MPYLDLIEDWCKAVRARVRDLLEKGQPVKGYKLVEGRKGRRDWTDTDVVTETLEDILGEEAYKKNLLTPAQAEKALKTNHEEWAELQHLIEQGETKPIVVGEDHPKPAIIVGNVADDFDDLE